VVLSHLLIFVDLRINQTGKTFQKLLPVDQSIAVGFHCVEDLSCESFEIFGGGALVRKRRKIIFDIDRFISLIFIFTLLADQCNRVDKCDDFLPV